MGYNNTSYYIYDPPLVSSDSDLTHTMMEFLIINLLDYIGWIAIFTRLQNVPRPIKTLANIHVSTAIVGLLGYEQFKNLFLITSDIYAWNLFRGVLVISDSVTRSYYHFYVL